MLYAFCNFVKKYLHILTDSQNRIIMDLTLIRKWGINMNNLSAAREISALHLPRYNELPTIELYMDQVMTVIDNAFYPFLPTVDGHILTPTMINNYVKQKIVSPPVKKRYKRSHLVYFISVALLKSVFSMAQIAELIQMQIKSSTPEVAYDAFCEEFEMALRFAFYNEELPPVEARSEAALLRSVVLSIAHKLYVWGELQKIAAKTQTERTEKKEKRDK